MGGAAKAPGGPEDKVEATAPEFSGPAIFTALQEQLRLRLEPQKDGVGVFVVDHAEEPAAN